MGILFFFDKTNTQVQNAYGNLFKGSGGKNKLSRWGWYNSLYQAAGKDIAKLEDIERMPFHKVMTFLSYEKDFYYQPKTKKK